MPTHIYLHLYRTPSPLLILLQGCYFTLSLYLHF